MNERSIELAAWPGRRRTPQVSRLRRRLEWSWVVTVVAFTLARLLLARETLMDYGLNMWVFGIIDLATAFPYALATARVVGAIVDRDLRAIGRWTAIAVGSFLAPYLYIAAAGSDGRFPSTVYVVLVVLILVFGGNAVRSTARRVKLARAERESAAAATVHADVASVVDEVKVTSTALVTDRLRTD